MSSEARIEIARREFQKLADELVQGGMREKDVAAAISKIVVRPVQYPLGRPRQ